MKGREEHRDSIALVMGSAASRGTLVKELSTSKADEKSIELMGKKLRKIAESDQGNQDIFLAALVRVGSEIIDSNPTKQKG